MKSKVDNFHLFKQFVINHLENFSVKEDGYYDCKFISKVKK
jgi:hypothetical protein